MSNLVVNGGFETGDFTGWTASAPNAGDLGVDNNSEDVNSGSYGVYAGNADTSTLSQSIATVAGQSYTVTFYLDVYQADATDGSITATFGDQTVVSVSEPGETDQNANPFTEYSVTLVADSASSLLQFTFVDPPGYFGLDDVSVTPVCYCRGTRILTERGEVAVEDLAEGDRVVTLSGRGPVLKPVTWLGRRRIDAARHPRPDEIHPIRIKADAFAAGVPYRDLLVSPGHAISVDGVLMTAKRLVNGVTIIQDRPIAEVEYFHVELAEHDLLLAEGLAAESYYDSGNRHFFENNGGPVELHGGPDDERLPATPRFRMTNAGNGVSEERRRRVEHATRQVRGKGLEQRYGSADFRCTTGTALFGMSNRKKAG